MKALFFGEFSDRNRLIHGDQPDSETKTGERIHGKTAERIFRDAGFIRNTAMASTAVAALEPGAEAQETVVGNYSNSSIAGVPGQSTAPGDQSKETQAVEIKIKRAMLSGPSAITKDATVMDNDKNGKPVVLHKGNHWICFPGDEK